MKKTLKKLTALTLVLMLMFSVMSTQASALTLFDKIVNVEPTVNESVTARELDDYIADMDEYGWEYEEDYWYTIPITYNVTISTGEIIAVDGYTGSSENGKRIVAPIAYVDIRDYQEAKENGADTLPLYYEVTLYSSISIELDSFKGETEIPLVDCYVKSLTPISGLPDTYRDNGIIGIIMSNYLPEMEEFDIEGAEFEIEYPDGTTVRDTVEWIADDEEDYEYYELNGEEIWYYFDEDESAVVINYADVYYVHPVEFIPFPVSEIVIDDVKVTDAFEAESVSYTVTKPDGTTQSYTYTFDGEPVATILGMDGYMAESVDGAYIIILVNKGYTEEYPATEIINVSVFADIDTSATETVEGATQEDNLLNRLIYRIRMFLMKIFEFLYYLY